MVKRNELSVLLAGLLKTATIILTNTTIDEKKHNTDNK
jgi:hypothetical protein